MISVIVADDHPIVRKGFFNILENDKDIIVVAEVSDGDALITYCYENNPDVAVTDITMPGPGIMQIMREIGNLSPRTRILIVSIHDSADYASHMIKAGAAGYISKTEPAELLPQAIKEVARGGIYLPTRPAVNVNDNKHGAEARSISKLSKREFEIYCLLGEGLCFKRIAERLNISPKTVTTYRTRIMEKLALDSTHALIAFASREIDALYHTAEY